MANPKQEIPDTEVAALIIAGCTNYQITKKFGEKPGCMYGQIKRLRDELGIASPGRRGGMDLMKKETPPPERLGTGVVKYTMSQEEIRERYGPPGLCATEKHNGEYQAESYLIEQATNRKEAAKCQRKK